MSIHDERETPEDEAQRERALGTWELLLRLEPPLATSAVRSLRRLLRIKRSEWAAFEARLPGCIRRGARVDLEPLAAALTQVGFEAELRRRPPRAAG